MKKILVAVDGSESAERALYRAKELGTPFFSHITILNVVEEHDYPGLFSIESVAGYELLIQKELKGASERLLDSYVEKFENYSGKVDTLTEFGKPADKIIKIAEKGEYDLIVIGSRGVRPYPGAMLGSVSNKVVNKSKVEVLLVH